MAGDQVAGRPTGLAEQVRDALLHLYDPVALQTHPLARFVAQQPGGNLSLRGKLLAQALLDAIESLHPPRGASVQSRLWRTYRILELRYIEGLSATDAANHLALSRTQYQRDHARALDAVVAVLRDRWQVDGDAASDPSAVEPRESLAISEVEQLALQMHAEDVDLVEMLSGLVALLQPVAQQRRTALVFHQPPDLPLIRGDRVVLRQVLLGLLNTALERSVDGSVDLALETRDAYAALTIATSGGADATGAPSERSPLELEVARRLLEATAGRLEAESTESGHWRACLLLPTSPHGCLLVVDNHPDFIDLVTRYLEGHGWQVVGASDVRGALARIPELRPDVVLVDVMMPGHDGWDLLVALRSRSEMRRIPVIVCSVLCEPQVAEAFGAAGYLTKPVSQEQILEALAPYRPGSRERVSAC